MNVTIRENKVVTRRYKQYHELDFTDNFMSCKILQKKPDLCRRLLETILNKKLKRIEFVDTEETIKMTSDGKGIRLICTFDFFKRGIPVYTFTNRCKELSDLELGDETVKIFINPYGDNEELSEDMEAFLKYLTGDKNQENDLVREIEEEVNTARDQKEWRVEYMTLFLRDQENFRAGKEEGFAEGKVIGVATGKAEERIEVIIDVLEEYGSVSENLREVIYEQTDLEMLKKWFKIAMKVSTVEEFEERIKSERTE